MRLFNSFQLVALYASLPFVIGWLDSADFRYSNAAFWVALVTYVISSFFMVAAVYNAFEEK